MHSNSQDISFGPHWKPLRVGSVHATTSNNTKRLEQREVMIRNGQTNHLFHLGFQSPTREIIVSHL